MYSISMLTILFALLLTPSLAQAPTNAPNSELVFQDMFAASGLGVGSPSRSLKFGGPTVADLDSDGNYDIILNFHNRNFTRVYFGDGNGNFVPLINQNNSRIFRPIVLDVHGINVARLTARSMDMLVSFAVGGGRGGNPRPAEMYIITPQREIFDTTNLRGLGQQGGRMRNTQFMDLSLNRNGRRRRLGGGPDALFVNFLVPPNGLIQYAYSNNNGQYSLVTELGDFSRVTRANTELTDINGDQVMELISIQELRFFRLSAPFNFVENTRSVLPSSLNIPAFTSNAAVELDFNNDGRFDLYIARADRALITRRPSLNAPSTDILLKNVGGRYVDITADAMLPEDTNSIGVTVGDFNNDGYIDILVAKYEEPDVFLINNQDETFRRVDNVIPKVPGDVGNNAMAVDYDLDGKVDAIVGHGEVSGPKFGPYLLLKNMMELDGSNNYLLVRVLNGPSRAATSLHALVTIFMPLRIRLVRRVGTRGAQGAGGSYLDTVHFGVGSVRTVNRVTVRWTSGIAQSMRNVPVNQKITFGVI